MCPRQDSNLRPSAPEADALSPELRGRGLDPLVHESDRAGTAYRIGGGEPKRVCWRGKTRCGVVGVADIAVWGECECGDDGEVVQPCVTNPLTGRTCSDHRMVTRDSC